MDVAVEERHACAYQQRAASKAEWHVSARVPVYLHFPGLDLCSEVEELAVGDPFNKPLDDDVLIHTARAQI